MRRWLRVGMVAVALVVAAPAEAAPKTSHEVPVVGPHTVPHFERAALITRAGLSWCDEAMAAGFDAGMEAAASDLRRTPWIGFELEPGRALPSAEIQAAKKELRLPRAPEGEALLRLERHLDADVTALAATQFFEGGSVGLDAWWVVGGKGLDAVRRPEFKGYWKSFDSKAQACEEAGWALAGQIAPQVVEQELELAKDPRIEDHHAAFEAGRTATLRRELEALLEEAPEDPLLHHNLGVVAELEGDLEAARHHHERSEGVARRSRSAARARLEALAKVEAYGWIGAEAPAVELPTVEVGEVGEDSPALRLWSEPAGAEVFLGADRVGTTPLEVRGLEPGAVLVSLVLADHRPLTSTVVLTAGEVVAVDLALERERGGLVVHAAPGSAVSVGELSAVVDPGGSVELELPVGTHPVRVSLEGHRDWRGEAEVVVGAPVELRAVQDAAPTVIELRGWSSGTVFIDGVEVGTGRVTREVEPGTHVIEIVAAGRAPYRREVVVEQGQREVIDYRLEKLRAELTVVVDPATVEALTIGGRPVELEGGRGVVELGAGRHTVRAEHPAHHPFEGSVEITGEGPQELSLALEPLPGRVLVLSSPIGAEVFFDGQSVGVTPLQLELPAGEALLRVEMDGHEPGERQLEVLPDQDHRLNVSLERAR